ncbi:uncharacterized protein LACBIDRAFT_309912 [Laccaria bicolor S238N-H82]|uniref:Predicted protein n=1 Tax=Laccaria bicolor (strain S238N-H82 / ATCC MYA-4686) TaxID=486041 RepID=B0DTB9_LACBS|nr:uncharacterized protein LACBIDRAFT_309912 [Laccaria bicolor S238N-H82]EDR02195.1 predicted protein [Laccaria bicolor S238N-H82]|eukprot:XP_001887140.1 predicted protein [Laccaria bicolor S238N-H82]
MSNNNLTGVNGYGVKNYPPDNELQSSLLQYAKERLTVDQRLQRLKVDHGLDIKSSKLAQLNNKFSVPSVRKPLPRDMATQAVLEKVAEDLTQGNGVGTIATLLCNEGISLPRDFIRNVLANHAPEGLARRFPGANRIHRSALVSIGPNHQHHADGHDKLNAQALNMGGVGFGIYGIKDQWTSFVLALVVVPNNRLACTTGHVHLDTVETTGIIPITFIMDKGSETAYIFANQTGLRAAYAPDIDATRFPAAQHLRSVHNTPIEGLWHWFLKTFGFNVRDFIRQGYLDGIYNPNNPVHPQLFYWLWPKILQLQLDIFVEYWNNHKIRYQKDKPNMSGQTPRHAFTVPPEAPYENCGIKVDRAVTDALRGQIPVSREDSMRWVDESFEKAAEDAYNVIGRPPLSMAVGWSVFSSMAQLIDQVGS